MTRVSKGTRTNKQHKPVGLPKKFQPGFLAVMDKRGVLYPPMEAMYEAIVQDLGGKRDVSEIKGVLIEKFVWQSTLLQVDEARISIILQKKEPTEEDFCELHKIRGSYTQAMNALSGLAKTLGIERRINGKPWLNPDSEPIDVDSEAAE